MSSPEQQQPAIFLSGTDYDLPAEIPGGLGKYTGFREMARGGNAVLRSCFDTITGRNVAIKTLQRQFRDHPRDNRRFLREARVTAQLQHPNTVPVYEIGRDESEGLYFTMKRISGENFFEVLKRIARNDPKTVAEFPVARRLEIVTDACQALAYAHARGVIHRDVKPENIWVGNFGEVVLLDWGSAKVWGQPDDLANREPALARDLEDPAVLQTLTSQDQRPGTPLYMAPEQVSRGGAGSIDERADIFGVGVVLYEMLTLREPFRGQVIAETFDNILNRVPPPPSERSPAGAVPPGLDEVVMKALEKKPGDRYANMMGLIAALQGLAA